MAIHGRLPRGVWAFRDDVLVECPRCGGLAHVRFGPWGADVHSKLTCGGCGHVETGGRFGIPLYESFRLGVDSWFGCPLWLRERVGNEIVWAYNWRHFEDLRFFLEGDWRDHRHSADWPGLTPTHGFQVRLPRWMHLKSNRAALLKALGRIQRRRWGKVR